MFDPKGQSNSQSIAADYKAKLMNYKSFCRLLVMPLYLEATNHTLSQWRLFRESTWATNWQDRLPQWKKKMEKRWSRCMLSHHSRHCSIWSKLAMQWLKALENWHLVPSTMTTSELPEATSWTRDQIGNVPHTLSMNRRVHTVAVHLVSMVLLLLVAQMRCQTIRSFFPMKAE